MPTAAQFSVVCYTNSISASGTVLTLQSAGGTTQADSGFYESNINIVELEVSLNINTPSTLIELCTWDLHSAGTAGPKLDIHTERGRGISKATAYSNYTVEPTVLKPIRSWYTYQQLEKSLDEVREIMIDAETAAGVAVRITPGATCKAAVNLSWIEG